MFKKKSKTKDITMNKDKNTDYQKLARALWWAKKNGYRVPALEQAIFDSAGSEPLRASLRRWAEGLVFDHDFAKAFFGDEEVDEYGQGVIGIAAWARQVAVEMDDGKIMVAEPNQRVLRYLKQQNTETIFSREPEDPTQVIDHQEIVEVELKKMYATIPLRTHRLEDVEVIGGIPAWKWHLQQMVISDNVFEYLTDYIDSKMSKPESPRA